MVTSILTTIPWREFNHTHLYTHMWPVLNTHEYQQGSREKALLTASYCTLASLPSPHPSPAFRHLQYGKPAGARNCTKACVTFILSPDVFSVERPLKQPKMAAAEVERILNAKSSHEWAVKEVRSLYLIGSSAQEAMT